LCLSPFQVKKAPPPSAPAPKKPPPSSSSAASKSKPPSSSSASSEPLKYKFSSEDAEARWEELVPAEFRAGLADSNWKARLEAGEKMTAWLDEGQAEEVESEVLFRFFSKIPGWSEKNFQVC
jgi:cytoskeleton-associated protein 5